MADEVESVRVIHHVRLTTDEIDPQASYELAADRRMIGLHARVDDRDGHAASVTVAEDGRAIERAKGSLACQPCPRRPGERLAPGRERAVSQDA